MPQFLEQRYGQVLPVIMAVFWLALYVFVNLTSIIWLGSIAVTKVAGVNQDAALIALGGVFLLTNMGYISGLSWNRIAQLWPVILVLIGFERVRPSR